MSVVPVPRAVVNRQLDRARVPRPGGIEVTEFHRRLPRYRPTRLHDISDIAAELHIGALHLKDESDRFGLPAFKILGASWAAEQTLRAQPETRVLVAASAGNHGRAVAHAASQRSLACRIHLPAAISDARAASIRGEGAEVVRVDGTYEDAVAGAELAAQEPGVALVADTAGQEQSDSASWVIDGYSTLFRELAEQSPVGFDVLMVPCGVGSLTAAAVRWVAHNNPTAAVLAVEPATAACVAASLRAGRISAVATPGTTMTGLDCATPSVNAWETLRLGLTGAISISDEEAHQSMRELAARGLTIGDCGAATIAALRALAADDNCAELRNVVRLNRATNVVCVATEGASDPAAYRQIVGQH